MYMDIFIWNMIIAHIVVNPYIGHYNSYWWYDHTPVWFIIIINQLLTMALACLKNHLEMIMFRISGQ